jgi:hypothetical protein
MTTKTDHLYAVLELSSSQVRYAVTSMQDGFSVTSCV